MKTIILSLAAVLFTAFTQAQNVGIGITNPAYPLTVQGEAMGKGIAVKNGTIEVGIFNNSSTAYIQTWSAHDLNFATNNGNAKITLSYANGFTGINTPSPTAQLDVNGTFRLRSNGAGAGNILTSDASGNATWQVPAVRSEVYSVGSVDFKSASGAVPVLLSGSSGGAYYTSAFYGSLVAPVHLPNGAKVNKIEVWYLDNEAENITFSLTGEITTASYSGGYSDYATLYSTGAVSNSFRTVTQTFPTPIVIDNESNNYEFDAYVHWSGSYNSFAVKSVKFYYTY